MSRAIRRLAAAVTSFALALGGVALAAVPAQAAEYVPTGTWNIPATGVDWGHTLQFDGASVFALVPPDVEALQLIAFDWRRDDNDAFLGSGLSYTVDSAAAGTSVYAALRVQINGGALDGDTTTLYSNRTNVIPMRAFSQPALSVSGEAIAGNALWVANGNWGATPSSYTWEWRRLSDNAIVGTGSGSSIGTYTVTSADVTAGSIFYAIVTAHLQGYTDATWATSFSQAAHLGSFANVTAVPVVTGTGHLGSSYSAIYNASGITPAPTTITFRWHTSDGTIIGTGATFTPSNALLGEPLYVTALLARADYNDYVTLGSAYSAVVSLAQFENVPAPTVSGSGRLGTSFTASLDANGITPTPATISYRWHTADGTIVGTGATFTPTNALLGETLYATAVLTAVDTADYVTLGSAETAPVSLAQFENVPTPTVSGTGRLGTSFTASFDTSDIAPTPATVSYRWHTTDGTIVGYGATFTPTNALLGEPLYATALLTAVDTADYATLGSDYTATVSLADQTPGAAPVITGRNVLGGELTASVDTSAWSPVPDSFSYRWFLEDGTEIADADEATLAVTGDLVGEVVYVVATAHAVDHFDYEIASAPTGRIAEPVLGASTASVVAGGAVTVEAWGLLLSEEYSVELHSDPIVLGTVVSALDGTISQSFTIPANTPAGEHTIVLLHDGVEMAEIALTVTAAPVPAAAIAATGTDADLTAMTVVTAMTLLAAGVLLVVSRRVASRRSSTNEGTR